MTAEDTALRAYSEGAQMGGVLQVLGAAGAMPVADYARGPHGPSVAVFSHDRAYRYVLTRRVKPGRLLTWLMLNPSTATASTDDPTITRVTNRATAGGFGGVVVVNLFALVTTDPKVLKGHRDPAGPGNDICLKGLCRPGDTVICAWGGGPYPRLRGRAAEVTRILTEAGAELLCLGTTTDGQPKHPGRLAYAEPVRPWRRP